MSKRAPRTYRQVLSLLGPALLAALAGCGSTGSPGSDAAAGSSASAAAEWETLFDGRDLSRWRGYRRQDVPSAWRIEDGTLAFVPGADGGDIITRDQFGDFELELEWKVEPGGNSGVFYRATEETNVIYENATEMQVLDNSGHRDGSNALTSSGANYALYAPAMEATRPAGQWNQVRIVARGSHVEHWLNGSKIVEYEQGGEDWKTRVAASKFAEWPQYGKAMRGHVGLQDHGDRVWYRNVRISRLDPGR